jgi:XTP/dITP diphosphohydrolase
VSHASHALVLATTNRGKLEELRALIGAMPVEIYSLDDVQKQKLPLVENGKTFAENAIKKARAAAQATMMLALADDSGLEVDALGGAPGVRSARYAHERATDAENNLHLLAALEAIADPLTTQGGVVTARFRCVLALVDPYTDGGEARTVEGTCEGSITRLARGSGGFGYDPLFLVDGTDKTMAELSQAEKNDISHRARAAKQLRPVLEEIVLKREMAIERIARLV